jgi:hypothetical protein
VQASPDRWSTAARSVSILACRGSVCENANTHGAAAKCWHGV